MRSMSRPMACGVLLAAFCAVTTSPAIAQAAGAAPTERERSAAPASIRFDTTPGPAIEQSGPPGVKRRDSIVNGLLIGAGIGALLGLIPDYYDDCEECHDSLYASIAVGAGIGVIIDLLKNNAQTTAPMRSGKPVDIEFALTPNRVQLGGTVRWP
jgi:hypothetical protein